MFYTGSSHTFSNGDKLVHGQQGEVAGHYGPGSIKGKAIKVLFPGNKISDFCSLTSVRRLPASTAATLCARAPNTRRCPPPQCTHDCLSPDPSPGCKRSSLRHSS